MNLTRRETLGVLAGVGLVGGCGTLGVSKSDDPVAPTTVGDEPYSAHLNRFGFGPVPGQVAALKSKGRRKWFEQQLAAPQDDEGLLGYQLAAMDINNFPAWELRDIPEDYVIRQLNEARIKRAVHSPWQLRERMVDFWSAHFSIYARKGLAAYRKPEDERNVIRKHVFGKFEDMLQASAKSTAMLLFLDQQSSVKAQPNENYAREIFELHSLGVEEGAYTQTDIQEAARCFTGWAEERRQWRNPIDQYKNPVGSFRFIDDFHDFKSKEVLGVTIKAGGGVTDGEMVVSLAANHPSTARYISKKLCAYFLGREDAGVVGPVSQTFIDSEGDLTTVLWEIFELSEAGEAEPVLKRPFDFVVSAIRSVDGTVAGGNPLTGTSPTQKALVDMSQPLYLWPMPDGWPLEPEAWTNTLLARWNFADDLTHGKMADAKVDLKLLKKRIGDESIASAILNRDAAHSTVAAVNSASGGPSASLAQQAALALSTGVFQWR